MGATIFTHFDSTTNKDLLKSGSLRQIFDTTLREAQTWSKKLYNVLTTKDEYERDLRMAGLTNTEEISEGQQIPIQAPVLGATKTYTQKSWAGGFRMTYRMDFFNKHGLFKRWAGDLARRQTEAKDIELAVPFVGPTGATRTGFDTLVLGHSTHTGLNPNTTNDNYDNLLEQALSQSALESARYYFATMVDDMGNLIGGTSSGGVLYYEPTLWPTVNEIFASDLRAQELSNTKNIVPKMGFEPYEYPRLTSTTAWGIAKVGHPKYDMNLFTSMEPKMFIRDAYDQTLDKVALSYQMFAYGQNGLDSEQSESENLLNSGNSLLWDIYDSQRDNPELSPLWKSVETVQEVSRWDKETVQATNALCGSENYSGMWGDPRMIYIGQL